MKNLFLFILISCVILLALVNCNNKRKQAHRYIHWYFPNNYKISLEDSNRIASHLDNELGPMIAFRRFHLENVVDLLQSDSAHIVLLPTYLFLIHDFDTSKYVPFLSPVRIEMEKENRHSYQFFILGKPKKVATELPDFSGKKIVTNITNDPVFTWFQSTIQKLNALKLNPAHFYTTKEIPKLNEMDTESDSILYLFQSSSDLDTSLKKYVLWYSAPFYQWILIVKKNLPLEEKSRITNALLNLSPKHTSPYTIERFIRCGETEIQPLRKLMKYDTTFFYSGRKE